MIGCRQLGPGLLPPRPGRRGSGTESLVCARGNVVVAVSTPPTAAATNMLLREIAHYLPEHAPAIIDLKKLLSDKAKLTEHCINRPEDDLMTAAEAVMRQ